MKSIHENFVVGRYVNYAPFDARDISVSKLNNMKKINKKISKEVSCCIRWDLIHKLVKVTFIDRIFPLPIYILKKLKY